MPAAIIPGLDPSNIPIPDPSLRTDALVSKEIKALREVLEERLRGMDKAIDLVAHQALQLPTAAQLDIANLRELQQEKFQSLINRFNEADKRSDRQEKEAIDAVRTAFDASNLAITKTENVLLKTEAFLIKQVDQLFAISQSSANRIQVLESMKEGSKEVKSGMSGSLTIIIAAIGVAVAVIVGAFSFIHSSTPVALPQQAYSQPQPATQQQPQAAPR